MTESSRLPQHISRQFDRDLQDVLSEVLAMGGLVEQQLHHAMHMLSGSDVALGEQIEKNENRANTYEVALDAKCMRLLVLRQPAASDLRLIMSVIKVITDLERIGDEAQKIAKLSKKHTVYRSRPYYTELISMGEYVTLMVRDALDALARMDSGAAISVASREPVSDEKYEAILRQLREQLQLSSEDARSDINMLWIVRSMERIGDHARNICEYVIYSVEGQDVRHTSIEQMKKKIAS